MSVGGVAAWVARGAGREGGRCYGDLDKGGRRHRSRGLTKSAGRARGGSGHAGAWICGEASVATVREDKDDEDDRSAPGSIPWAKTTKRRPVEQMGTSLQREDDRGHTYDDSHGADGSV